MPLSPKQVLSIRESTTTKNRSVWDGAIRSGKTIASLLAWLKWIPDAPRGGLAIIGKTRVTIGRNILETIEQIEPKAIAPYAQKSDVATIMGRRVHLIGASDAQAENKLRGLTLAGAYVDEITLLQEPMWVQLTGRLSVPGARLFATTNPDNPAHWLKANYLDRIVSDIRAPHEVEHPDGPLPEGWGHWHFTMDDNPGLEPERIEAWKREFTGLWYRRFILGHWVSAEGAIFDMWDPPEHVVPHAEIPPLRDFLAVGYDYGTVNATAAIALGVGEDGIIYAVNEKRIDSTNRGLRTLTDQEQSRILKKWVDQPLHPRTDLKPRWNIVDPAAASLKAQMGLDGFWNITDADNDVLYGIKLISTGLAAGWLKISDQCKALIKEMPGYSWNKDAEKLGADVPNKAADHSIDALRYALVTTENRWRHTIDQEVRAT